MLEVEVFGAQLLAGPLPQWRVQRLCALALASAGVEEGHLAVEFVGAERMAELNGEHRRKDGPTMCSRFPSMEPIRTLPEQVSASSATS